MAGERVKLAASERTHLGSRESRRLRRQGLIPGVLYGKDEPVAIVIGERELRAALTTAAGGHAVLDVAIDGGAQHSAILKDYQRDVVRGMITHVDLQEVRLDQTIQTSVEVALVGDPIGVREGGVLSQVTNEISIEALPLEVPQGLEVDVSWMGIGDTLRLTGLVVPEGVTLLDDPEEVVLATVALPTLIVEPEVEPEEGEEAEAAEGEGEEPAAGESGGEAGGEG